MQFTFRHMLNLQNPQLQKFLAHSLRKLTLAHGLLMKSLTTFRLFQLILLCTRRDSERTKSTELR